MSVYLDDICLYSKTSQEHITLLRDVLASLRQSRLCCQLSKCQFAVDELLFLGHIVSADGVRPDPAKVECVQNWPQPQNVHDVRRFLGLTNYFKRYMYNYSDIACPLTDLTRQNAIFEFGPKQIKAFTSINIGSSASVTRPHRNA